MIDRLCCRVAVSGAFAEMGLRDVRLLEKRAAKGKVRGAP